MKVKKRVWAWLAAALAVFAIVMFGTNAALALPEGQSPAHDKQLIVNSDGTYTIALNVTGDAVKDPQKVNVIVIIDRSGSMADSSGTSEVTYTPNNQTGTTRYGTDKADPDVHNDDDFFPLTRRGYANNYVYTYASQGSTAYAPTDANNGTQYGLVDGNYVQLTRRGGGFFSPYYWTYGGNPGTQYNGTRYTLVNNAALYTGQRYTRQADNQSRLEATQEAVNGLASALLAHNGEDGNPDDTVEMALVSFATTATTNISDPVTDYSTFSTAVNNLNADGGTNWESALDAAADIDFDDNDPTFVIFFSDGAPTFHSTDGGYGNWNGTYGVYGSGQEQEPNMERSYTQAADDAKALAEQVGAKYFYTIFAYGEDYGATYMTNLTAAAGAPAANNYSASNTAALQAAFDEILEQIEMSGIGSVDITDGTTSRVTTTTGEISNLLTVDTSSYKYYRAGGIENGEEKYDSSANGGLGEEWEDAPAATFENGAVEWDLSSEGVLENDVTYTVTFDCWPSQTTLDIVADIRNNPSSYNTLDANIRKYIDSNGNLKTNTDASLSWTDTRDNTTDSSEYENPAPVPTQAVEQLAVSKKWENELDGQSAEEITLNVTRDGASKYNMTLSKDSNWSDNVYVSIGILRHSETGEQTDSAGKKYEVLETGHDFTFTEPKDLGYYWELEVPTVRPMLIDGTVTILILKGDAPYNNPNNALEYTIGDNTYYVGGTGTASLTATNHRRARLNLTKVVDGADADPNQTFRFTLNVVNSKASEGSADNLNSDYYVWFSIYNNGPVDGLVSGAEKEMKDGAWTGYYYAPSGSNIVVDLKAGDNLRFLNLPTGSTYTFTEGTLPDNYAFVSSELTTGEDGTFIGAQTTTGTIESTNTNYAVTYTNKYDLTDIEITKVWEDNDDQDGMRPTAEEFVKYLVLKADGTDVTSNNADKLEITDNEDGTYTIKWTGLNRFLDGEEITYTVEETEIEGYTTTGSPADDKGTITNTHEPEVTTVTVEKVWDDGESSDRPASVTVTLSSSEELPEGVTAEQTLSATNDWTYTWENLPKYADGEPIEYSVSENKVDNYETEIGEMEETENGYSITITNTRDTNDLTIVKVVEGDAEAPDATTFTVTGPEGFEKTTVTLAEFEDEDESGNPAYTFEDVPTGEYTVVESSADVDGYTLTTTYSNEGKGTVTKDSPATITVTNTYESNDVTVTKTFAGAELTDAQKEEVLEAMTVTLTPEGDGAPLTANYDADAEAFVFEAVPNGTYTVTESGAKLAGYTFEMSPNPATVTVNDADAELAITNTYTRDTGSLTVTKVVEGDPALADLPDGFTITVKDADGNTYATVTKDMLDENGSYTLTGVPTGAYTVAESNAEITNYGLSSSPVYDGDESATSAAVTKGETAEAEITNTYTRDTGSLTVTKVVEGDPALADLPDGFTITVKDADGNTYATVTKDMLDENGSYTLTGVPTGDYTATEANYIISGYTVSTATNPSTATVEKDGTAEITITNTYTAAPTSVVITAKKVLEGATLAAAQFSFTLSGDSLDDDLTATNDADGTVTFDAITLSAEGTYTFTVTEVKGDKDYITYDVSSFTVTVVVEANDDGSLKVASKTGDGEDATFTNTYSATGEVVPSVKKVLTGRTLEEGKFSFTLSGDSLESDLTATNGADGAVEFDAIEYTLEDVKADVEAGKATQNEDGTYTYTYTITEVDGGDKGYTYDTHPVTLTVTLIDDGEGNLEAVPSYAGETTFTNTYEASGNITFEGTKTLENKTLTEGQFTFQVIEGEEVIAEITHDADGAIAYPTINYNLNATTDDTGEHTYIVKETSTDGNGITVDTTEYTVTVTVEDNGDSTLNVTSDSATGLDFVNTYDTEPITIVPNVTKKYVGHELEAGAFTFELSGDDLEDPMTATNAADGQVIFDAIEYKLADVGEHTYTIREIAGNETYIDYDEHEVTLTVTVTDNGDGTLKATTSYSPDKQFVNTYKPTPVSVDPPVQKIIEGNEDLYNGGDFTFTIACTSAVDADGNAISNPPMPANTSITNSSTYELTDKEGWYEFGVITFTQAGTYEYTVTESGSVANVTNDSESSKKFTFTVTDDGEGTLSVSPETDDAAWTFTNVYEEPPTPPTPPVKPPVVPKTGDETPTGAMATLAMFGVAALAAATVLRRKRS